jgi:hypothetical protein
VLSRPENPDHGTQTDYKRVVRTMVHCDKPVIYGSFNYSPEHTEHRDYPKGRAGEKIIMTPDHPFWLQAVGWTAASLLREDVIDWRLFKDGVVELKFIDFREETLLGGYHAQVLVTGDPKVGWVRGSSPLRADALGRTYDMVAGTKLSDATWDKFWDYLDKNESPDDWDLSLDDPVDSRYIYKATVHNIEVEDWHTYFVGELGVWVHNANCDFFRVSQSLSET